MVIIGAGQHARVAASVLEAAGISVAGFCDDDPESWGRTLSGGKVLGSCDRIPPGSPAIVAVGDNGERRRMVEQLDLEWISVVHPFSWLHPAVPIGPGTLVCSGVTVQVGAEIGAHVVLNNGAGVGHDARVADFAHLTVAHLSGEAVVGEGAMLGVGSVVLPRVRVGAWATVGAGAVAFKDVPSRATVLGVPAREISRHHRP